MHRILLAPLAVVALCLAFLIPLVWTEYFRDHIWPNWSAEKAYSGDLNDQRRLASCYELGCSEVMASPILACAWREIILDETDRFFKHDVVAANRDCSRVSQNDREIVERAESDIRARLHARGKI